MECYCTVNVILTDAKQLKPLTLRMNSPKLLDVLTSLLVNNAILPCAVCFATSRPANHATCSYISGSG